MSNGCVVAKRLSLRGCRCRAGRESVSPSVCNAARVMKQQWGGKSMYKGVTPVKDLGAYERKNGEKS